MSLRERIRIVELHFEIIITIFFVLILILKSKKIVTRTIKVTQLAIFCRSIIFFITMSSI